MELLLVFLLALCIDSLVGEIPSSIHPVVWIGKGIELLKKPLGELQRRESGILLTSFLLLLFNAVFFLIMSFSTVNYVLFLVVAAVLLSTTFAIRSLFKAVDEVRFDLEEDLARGRKAVSMLVSRDTSILSSEEVVSAAIESLTENITDSVTAPIFYLVLVPFIFLLLQLLLQSSPFQSSAFQIPGIVISPHALVGLDVSIVLIILGVQAAISYRVINTLDAMVGYKDPENMEIGWFPARTDDYLNYIPARITGVLVVVSSFLMGLNWRGAWDVMKKDARETPSPNSGYPMAAAAGALGICLVKPGVYKLGKPIRELEPATITEALLLAKVTILIFIIITAVILVI